MAATGSPAELGSKGGPSGYNAKAGCPEHCAGGNGYDKKQYGAEPMASDAAKLRGPSHYTPFKGLTTPTGSGA